MVRIPTYDSARVAPSAGGIAAPSVNPTEVAGGQIERAGAALGEAGSRAVSVGNALLDQVNQTRVQQAANALANKATDLRYGSTSADGVRMPGYSEMQGESVMHSTGPDGQTAPLVKAYPQRLQQAADEISAGLTPAQQRMFAVHSGAVMAQFNNEVAAHSAQQLQVWRATVNNDTLTSAANSVASALGQFGTPQFDVLGNTAGLNARGAINRILADKGVVTLDQEGKPTFADDNARTVYDTESKALLGKYVGTIVQAGVQNQQAPAALKYLESQKAFMAPQDYAAAHAQVAAAAQGTTALDQVDNVLGTVWTNHAAPPDEEKIDAALRAANHDNPDQLAASRAEVRARVASWSFNRDQANEQATQQAGADVAAGKSIAYIQRQPYWNNLNGSAKLTVTNQANSFGEQTLSRTFTAAGRAGQLDPEIISYGMDHGLTEPQARALAALSVGEGGVAGQYAQQGTGGHGTYGLFQLRDSGGLQDMLKAYGGRPTKLQEVDWFLNHYSKGNAAFRNAATEADAMRALAIGQGAGSGMQGILDRGSAALAASSGGKGAGQMQAEQWIANPGQLGPATPENTQRIMNTVGAYWAPKVIAAQRAYQGAVTKQAMPKPDEVNAAMAQLGISVGSKDPDTVAIRANVRSALNAALLAATQEGQKQLSPQERAEVIQKAAAVEVQQHHWYNFFGDSPAKLLSLAPKDYDSITIPAGERERAAQGMQAMYARTRDARYAPNEDNLRRYFLNAHGLMQVPNGQ